ncbi:MAG TPA: PH domain-containing protein [Candidatus Moranbacteria bacterium]|nr:PH domain-containing protein [Candidatus Moranbacteria bacterium]
MRNYKNFHFEGQKSDEQILIVLHRFWFDILSQFFVIFAMLFILIGSFIWLPLFFPELQNESARKFFLFLENTFFMLLWIISFLVWIDYYFDVWIVTDRRIVNIEQKGLFSRTISELELEKVQDITTNVHGVIPTFLNYGDLQVQTAAEQEKFLFHNIPDPYSVKDLIMNLQKKQERKEKHIFSEMIAKKVHHEDSI